MNHSVMIRTQDDKVFKSICSAARAHFDMVNMNYCVESTNHTFFTEPGMSKVSGRNAIITILIIRIAKSFNRRCVFYFKRFSKTSNTKANFGAILRLLSSVRFDVECFSARLTYNRSAF